MLYLFHVLLEDAWIRQKKLKATKPFPIQSSNFFGSIRIRGKMVQSKKSRVCNKLRGKILTGLKREKHFV